MHIFVVRCEMKKVEGTDRNGISGHQKTKIDFIRLSLNCGKITGGGGRNS